MKFTYNWLKQYVDFDWSPQELAEKLTFAGIEVEDIVSFGGGVLEQVVVCQILSSEKHPNADKLTVCRVNDGKGERQIVCGAKNYKVGDKVPLALPGVTLPGNFTIKPAKLRGVESQGMMCSAEELGLPKGEDGLLILPADTPVGIKLSEALGGGGHGVRHRGDAESARLAERDRHRARGVGVDGESAEATGDFSSTEGTESTEKLDLGEGGGAGFVSALHGAGDSRREDRAEPRVVEAGARKGRDALDQ